MKADTLPCKNLTRFCSRTPSFVFPLFKDHKDRKWWWFRKGKKI